MASSILVKVVGFGETERHSLNTLFRLSEGSDLTYGLWTSDSSKAADVVLIDVDSQDASAEMALAEIEADGPKLICVGDLPVESAWRSFKRPVDWGALVGVLDAVFVTEIHNPSEAAPTESPQDEFPFDGKVCLLVGFSRENALYLRARLALAGMCDVDEADSVIQANAEMRHRHYGLVIVDMGLNDLGTWGFVQALTSWDAPRRSVVVASAKLSRKTQELADQFGCTGVLGIPFEPQQVCNLLLKV